MSKTCNQYQEILIDVFYEEGKLDEDIKEHINNCQDCRKYYEELQQMKIELNDMDSEIPIEYMNISEAFNKAEDIQRRKSNLFSLAIFMIISSIILTLVTMLAIAGYSQEIIYFQLGMYFLLPILLPIIIKVRVAKEGYNE